MSVRIGNPRGGHRVGGFYVSAPLTGRNAGRQVRVGHRLPGGLHVSVPIRATRSRRPRPPIGSLSRSAMIATTIVYVGFAVLLLVVGVWILAVPLLVATVLCWLRRAANPQQRQRRS